MSHLLTQRRWGLWAIVQPTTRRWWRHFGFTFGEMPCRPSSHTIYGPMPPKSQTQLLLSPSSCRALKAFSLSCYFSTMTTAWPTSSPTPPQLFIPAHLPSNPPTRSPHETSPLNVTFLITTTSVKGGSILHKLPTHRNTLMVFYFLPLNNWRSLLFAFPVHFIWL